MFDGLGISPTDSLSLTSATSPTSASSRTEEMAERSPYLGASAPEFSSLRVSPHAPNGAFMGKMPMPKHPFAVSPVSETCSRSGSRADARRMRAVEIDVAEGWRNEKVIYQCACVADL